MVIYGTAGADQLSARSPDGDVLIGLSGDDVLVGWRGADILQGGDGNDQLYDSDGGADQLYGGYGNDVLTVLRYAYDGTSRDGYHQTPAHLLLDGGPGDDALNVSYTPLASSPDDTFGSATLLGGDGDDTITADHVPSTVDGGAGDDFIEVDYASAVITGGAGADTINATTHTGTVRIDAGTGNDAVYVDSSSTGAVSIDGGPGDDTIYASAQGKLTVVGGLGDDAIVVSGPAVTVDAGPGNDTVTASAATGSATVTLGLGADRLILADHSLDASPAHVRVTDFQTGATGDVLDLSGVLAAATTFNAAAGSDPVAEGFVRFVQQGADTRVQVYEDGAARGGSTPYWHDEVLLQGVAASSLTSHNLQYFS